jgi:CDP-diacylglycerol--glycerol-3-phosphate 3-phosphatidyltransferase
MITVGEKIGGFFSALRDRLAHILMKTKLTPNLLTLTGASLNLVVAFFLATGLHVSAGIMMIIASSFDVLDGALARASDKITAFGDFLDSSIDRYSDLILFSGLIFFYSFKQDILYLILTCIVIMGSVGTSYVRAKGQNVLPIKCDAGFMERPERIITLIVGALSHHLYVSLWVLAFLTNLTVIHRILFVKKGIERIDEVKQGAYTPDIYEGKTALVSSMLRILFLDFERMTWQYDAACGTIILFLIFPPF